MVNEIEAKQKEEVKPEARAKRKKREPPPDTAETRTPGGRTRKKPGRYQQETNATRAGRPCKAAKTDPASRHDDVLDEDEDGDGDEDGDVDEDQDVDEDDVAWARSAGPPLKWGWYPASSFPALAEWLRRSQDAAEAALADEILEPPELPAHADADEAADETAAVGAGGGGDDADIDPLDPAAAAAAAVAAARRLRGGGTVLDGYLGLDRPLLRGVSSEGGRTLVALRTALVQTLQGVPFWEGAGGADTTAGSAEWCRRLVPLAAAARIAACFTDVAAAIAAAEALLFDAGHLVGGWRTRRDSWWGAPPPLTTPVTYHCLPPPPLSTLNLKLPDLTPSRVELEYKTCVFELPNPAVTAVTAVMVRNALRSHLCMSWRLLRHDKQLL